MLEPWTSQPPIFLILQSSIIRRFVLRYIQSVYGLEVAILGLKDVLSAMSVIDNYIRSAYGDVIAFSRMALNGDAYCVVFKEWSQTSRFLNDPFTAFDSSLGISLMFAHCAPLRSGPSHFCSSFRSFRWFFPSTVRSTPPKSRLRGSRF